MAILEFIGCSCIAFGPSFSLFCVTIASCPIRVIIFITSAFFWLVSLLLSSIVWWIAQIIIRSDDKSWALLFFGVLQAVCLQELLRYVFYRVLRSAEAGLRKMIEVGSDGNVVSDSRQTTAYVSGLGFGSMSGGFAMMNILALISGPASLGLDNQSEWFVLVSSITTNCFIVLNTALGVALFEAYDRKQRPLIALLILAHLGSSLCTLFNHSERYYISLPFIALATGASMVAAFLLAGGRIRKLRCLLGTATVSEETLGE